MAVFYSDSFPTAYRYYLAALYKEGSDVKPRALGEMHGRLAVLPLAKLLPHLESHLHYSFSVVLKLNCTSECLDLALPFSLKQETAR